MTAASDWSEELRKPFPDGTVGKLPKPYKRESQKGNCNECGGYHGLPAAHLDFVGHAAVTDRLLSVDPAWTWEPAGVDERGLPALDREGNLWIRLTICGVTRLGVGDGPNMKERIGDALRNAAMRFGVALALWTKDELESGAHEQKAVEEPPRPPSLPDDTVPAVEAKRRLLAAYEGDKAAASHAWGTRGHDPITEAELAELIASADASRPFTEGSTG